MKRSGQDALIHFVCVGADEGRNPNPLFDLKYYQSQITDSANEGGNLLLHYCRFGASSGLNPHPLFHTDYYLQQCGDGEEPIGENPLNHFLTKGARLQFSPHPLFDYKFFLAQISSVEKCRGNALLNYLSSSDLWDIDPHPLFDVTYYKLEDPLVSSAGMAPLLYYVLYCATSPADPHPLFQGAWYRQEIRGVSEKKLNPLVHYLMHGQYEGKNPFKVKNEQDKQKEKEGKGKQRIAAEHYNPESSANLSESMAAVKLSVIVWGDKGVDLALQSLQTIFQAVLSAEQEVIVCSSGKNFGVMSEKTKFSQDNKSPIQYCHSSSTLVKTLQQASLKAKGTILVFINSEIIVRAQNELQQFFSFVARQNKNIVCCEAPEKGGSWRQKQNESLIEELSGANVLMPDNYSNMEEKIILPTVECMAVRSDLFLSLHGFNLLYEQYCFEADFIMKALAEGVRPDSCPESPLICMDDTENCADSTSRHIDKCLFLDTWQAVFDANMLTCRDCIDLSFYMEKKRDEIFQNKKCIGTGP